MLLVANFTEEAERGHKDTSQGGGRIREFSEGRSGGKSADFAEPKVTPGQPSGSVREVLEVFRRGGGEKNRSCDGGKEDFCSAEGDR